jgi:hypothetical protein
MTARQRYEERRQRRGGSTLSALGVASLLLLGLIVGLGGGLVYAWTISPIAYVSVGPSRLSASHKETYIFLIAQNYALDGDWPRAESRLNALEDPALSQTVADLLQRYLRQGESETRLRPLALLADQLGVTDPAVALFVTPEFRPTATPTPTLEPTTTPTLLPTPTNTPPPTATPSPTWTPAPTTTPSPTPLPVYRLLNQERVCEPDRPAPRIEVITLDVNLEQLPGVALLVSWDSGTDQFFTGFKPELGLGYGDFTMAPEVSYSVVVMDGSSPVSGLRVENCPASEGGQAGGWRLTFQNTQFSQATATPEPTSTR